MSYAAETRSRFRVRPPHRASRCCNSTAWTNSRHGGVLRAIPALRPLATNMRRLAPLPLKGRRHSLFGGPMVGTRKGALRPVSAAQVAMRPRSTRRGFRTCAKQTPADGFRNERERFLCFMGFDLGGLSAELQRRHAIFIGVQSRLSLLQGTRGVLQLAIDIQDGLPSLALGRLSSLFSQLQSFRGTLAQRLGAGFGLPGMIFHAAEDFGGLVDQIESGHPAIRRRWPTEAHDVFVPVDRSSQTALRHVVRDLVCGSLPN